MFDGVCVFCNGWVRFLLRHDRRARYRYAAMQNDAGRALLTASGLDPEDPASFLLVEYDRAPYPRVSTNTLAIRRLLVGLGGPWQLAGVMALVPAFLRDGVYRWFARNRYRWFGRHDACVMPTPEARARFL